MKRFNKLVQIIFWLSMYNVSPAQVINIIDLHNNDQLGRPAAPFTKGSTVSIAGIVTSGTGVYSATHLEVYVQDSTAGVNVFNYGSIPQTLDIGDSVLISGIVDQYKGLTEITNPNITVLSSGNQTPVPLVLTCAEVASSFHQDFSEPNEGRLVRVNNCTFERTSSLSGTLRDGTGECILFLDPDVELSVPSGVFDVIGILKQYDNSEPFTSEYEISPRSIADFVSSAGPIFLRQPYESKITASAVSISWETDSPSTSQIKFGKSSNYELGSIGDSSLVRLHSITLTGLEPATIYRALATSTDESGTGQSDVFIFSSGSSDESRGIIIPYFNKSVEHQYSSGVLTNGSQNLSSLVINRIDSARYSIDLCIYYFSLGDVASRLIAAKNRGVKIRVIYESENETHEIISIKNAGIPVLHDRAGSNDGVGAMHNKFLVFDYRDKSSAADDWVWTGSYNLTYNGTIKNAENGIAIQDEALAACYTVEFQEMWGSETETPNPTNSRFGARKLDNTPHRFNIGNKWVEQYMSPSDDTESHIIDIIESAEFSAYFCILSFTRSSIANAMRNKWNNRNGFLLKGVFDPGSAADQFSQFSNFDGTGDQPFSPRPDVHLANELGSLHHKYLLVDAYSVDSDPVLVTGSHNWSLSANNKNDENTLIIHDAAIANQYLQEFAARYHRAGGNEEVIPSVNVANDRDINGKLKTFRLAQNYPNPFNATTFIRLEFDSQEITRESTFTLVITDVLGKTIQSWDIHPCGVQIVQWDGTDYNGVKVSSGVYLYSIFQGAERNTKKMLLLE